MYPNKSSYSRNRSRYSTPRGHRLSRDEETKPSHFNWHNRSTVQQMSTLGLRMFVRHLFDGTCFEIRVRRALAWHRDDSACNRSPPLRHGGLFGRPSDANFNSRGSRLICRSRKDYLVTTAFAVHGAAGKTANNPSRRLASL